MLKIDNIPDLIKLIREIFNDEFDYYIDNVDSAYYFLHGGCYELAKIVNHYFPDTEFVIRFDNEHVAILEDKEIYDAYDSMTLEELVKNNIPEKEFQKRLEDYRVISKAELDTYPFGVQKTIMINGNNVAEGMIKEIDDIRSIEIQPKSKEVSVR